MKFKPSNKIQITVIFLALALILIIIALPFCQQLMVSHHSVDTIKCCDLYSKGSMGFDHISYFQQLSQLISSVSSSLLVMVFAVIIFASYFCTFRFSDIVIRSKSPPDKSMKPYDLLLSAFRRGIIQRKHLVI